MKTIKTLTIIILPTIGTILLCLILTTNILKRHSIIANEITGDKIKKVEIGITLEEVLSILGKPFTIETKGDTHSMSCKNPNHGIRMNVTRNIDIISVIDNYFNDTVYCCEGNKEAKQRFGKNVTLTYTKRPCLLKSFFIPYPMLWVHLDSNYCVRSVYAKRYNSPDDICIYSLSWKTDKITGEYIPGEVNLFINEELFDKCFGSANKNAKSRRISQ